MEKPISPEEGLSKELRKQEREIHSNLFYINQLFTHCCDESLSMNALYKKCKPILEKLQKDNLLIAKEIEDLILAKDRQKLLDYFEQEKQNLLQILSDETKRHQAIVKLINDIKNNQHPTDS